jgi:hypothetical protein
LNLGNSSAPHLTPEQRKAAAMAIWNHEKGLAAAVIIVSWMFKVRLFPPTNGARFQFALLRAREVSNHHSSSCTPILLQLSIFAYANPHFRSISPFSSTHTRCTFVKARIARYPSHALRTLLRTLEHITSTMRSPMKKTKRLRTSIAYPSAHRRHQGIVAGTASTTPPSLALLTLSARLAVPLARRDSAASVYHGIVTSRRRTCYSTKMMRRMRRRIHHAHIPRSVLIAVPRQQIATKSGQWDLITPKGDGSFGLGTHALFYFPSLCGFLYLHLIESNNTYISKELYYLYIDWFVRRLSKS